MKKNQEINRSILFWMLAIALTVSSALFSKPNPAAPAKTQAAAQTLKAEDKDGLPVPADYVDYSGEKSAYLQKITAASPSAFNAVLEFYRRELKAGKWLELPGALVVPGKKAALTFENAQKGRLTVLLVRNEDGKTGLTLAIKDAKGAKADGVLPPAGKARIYLGNMTEKEVVFAINQKKIAVKVESTDKKSPMKDAPCVEVAPGKYPFTLTRPGEKPEKDVIEVGANEIWGLIAGPGGALPLQMY
jgi:hypothetical protein